MISRRDKQHLDQSYRQTKPYLFEGCPSVNSPVWKDVQRQHDVYRGSVALALCAERQREAAERHRERQQEVDAGLAEVDAGDETKLRLLLHADPRAQIVLAVMEKLTQSVSEHAYS